MIFKRILRNIFLTQINADCPECSFRFCISSGSRSNASQNYNIRDTQMVADKNICVNLRFPPKFLADPPIFMAEICDNLRSRYLLVIVLIFLILPSLYAEQKRPQVESDQQINEFSLAGYGERGKKSWDLSGKSADIFQEVIELKDVVGNLYGKKEDIKLTADRGNFNKVDGKIHLEQNVIITTSLGTKLTTNSLDWDRKAELVTTKDNVNIQRENMVVEASGAKGEPNLKKVVLEKEVRLDIKPVDKDKTKGEGRTKEKIIITCDGPLEIDYEKNIASFNNNVKVDRGDSEILSDKMDVFFTATKDTSGSDKTSEFMGSKIDKIIARGNVKVVRGENISYSEEAIYTASDGKIVLSGRPKLIIYSSGDFENASSGD